MAAMEPLASAGFCAAARLLADAARRHGLRPPGFRSPPRLASAVRAIRRYPDGQAVVSVRVRGRPRCEVVADMVEGVVVANGLRGRPAEAARRALLSAVTDFDEPAAPVRAKPRVAA